MEPAAWEDVFDVRVGSIDPPGPAIVGQKISGETGLRILHLKLTGSRSISTIIASGWT
jgi:hypothetical protein